MADRDMMKIPEVISFGKCPFDQIWAENEHVDPCTELMHVLHGRVEVITRDYTIIGNEGDTIYTPADMPHRDIFSIDRPFEVYLIQFNWAGEAHMLRSLHPTKLATISRTAKKRIALDFHPLYQDFVTDLPFSREMVSLQLLQIIYRLQQNASDIEEHSDTGSARRTQIMSQAKRVIEEKHSSPITLENIANELNISPYYLSRVFSHESGFTLSQYLRDVRMEQAAEMLLDPSIRVSEIAIAVGFSDPIYFRKVFKSHFGLSPKAYRESRCA